MNFRSYLTFFVLLCCLSLGAQTTAEKQAKRAKDRTKNRVENRAQNKVDRSVDQAVDDAFNAVGNLFKKKKKQPKTTEPTGAKSPQPTTTDGMTEEEAQAQAQGMDMINQMLGGGKKWEPYTNPNTFSLRMNITETKKNGKQQQSIIDMGVTTDRFAIVMAGDGNERNKLILNTQDGMTTMITTDKKGEKSGYRLRIPSIGGVVEETAAETMERYTFERTGERRTIEGYNCEKIIVTDTKEGTVTESWVTKDLPLTAMEVFGGMAKAFGAKAPQAQGAQTKAPYEGFPIESTTTENGKTYITKFQNLRFGEANFDRSLLDTEGVQLVGFGSWN